MYGGIPYHVKQGAGNLGITAENMEKSQHTSFSKDMIIRLMKVLVWPVATCGCESWTLSRKNEETCRLSDERAEEDSAGFRGQQRKLSGFLTKLD